MIAIVMKRKFDPRYIFPIVIGLVAIGVLVALIVSAHFA